MQNYELTIVFHPDLEMNLDPALTKVRQILEGAKGNIIKEENDGKKRLAYPIKGQEFGIYYFMDVELPTTSLDKISSVFNITDEMLRYLLVRADANRAKFAAKKAESAPEPEEASPEKEEEK